MPVKKGKKAPGIKSRATTKNRNRKNKFSLYTLLFIAVTLVITVFAVQQQQIFVQDAAKKDDCITDVTQLTDKQQARKEKREARQAARAERRGNNPKKEQNPCETEKNKKDKKEKKENRSTKKNDNKQNRSGSSLICWLAPNLSFCKGEENCETNPSKDNTKKNNSGRDGQENTSNNPGTVTIGDINTDDTTDTTITINGKEITGSNANITATGEETTIIDDTNFQDGQDINTGGKQGGSHRTEININRDGQDQTVDRSGSDGNLRTNADGGCDNQNDATGDKSKKSTDKKAKNVNEKNKKAKENRNGGRKKGLLCRLAPWFGNCK